MNGKIQQLRDLVIMACALGALVIFGYEKLNPKPAESDRIEATAQAFLEVQPGALEKAASAVEGGFIKVDGVADFIKAAHLGPSGDLASALKDANYTPAALRRAAAAQRKRMR